MREARLIQCELNWGCAWGVVRLAYFKGWVWVGEGPHAQSFKLAACNAACVTGLEAGVSG